MDTGNYLQWSRLTLHMHAGLIGWNRRDTNQVNLVRGWSRPGWRSPEEWLEWAGAAHQETGRGLGITRIFHEEKINACPAPRWGLRQTSPRLAVLWACMCRREFKLRSGERRLTVWRSNDSLTWMDETNLFGYIFPAWNHRFLACAACDACCEAQDAWIDIFHVSSYTLSWC